MDENQLQLPDSFVDLYRRPGQLKPSVSREQLAERFELCDDMSRMLCEPASEVLIKLGVSETDVLRKMLQGLLADGGALSEPEALWVVCRLGELLSWPVSPHLATGLSEPSVAWMARQFRAAV